MEDDWVINSLESELYTYSLKYKLCSVQCKLYKGQRTPWKSTIQSLQSTVSSTKFAVYSMQYIICTVPAW